MERTPLVSIVVACYNVEKYVARCIDSLLAQTYKNIEIVLVDDGSVDGTSTICDKYAKEKSNIKVVHQINQGQSVAKNVGVANARGEYLTFVDSDDTVTTTYVDFLYNAMISCNAQVAITSFKLVKDPYDIVELGDYSCYRLTTLSPMRAVEQMFYQRMFDTTAPCKMYRRCLFDNVEFPVGVSYDDLPTIYKVMLKAEKIAFSDYQSYNYLIRNESIEGSAFNMRKYESMNIIVEQMEKDELLYPIRNAVRCRIFSFMFRIYMSMPNTCEQKTILWNKIKSLRWRILFNSKSRRKAKCAALLSLGGQKLIKKVYKRIKTR
ncbi:MAG: glycosyltransferase [Bacteroidales bacterium]|nr:glycosyltransferase [Bacteroidales bacterium]